MAKMAETAALQAACGSLRASSTAIESRKQLRRSFGTSYNVELLTTFTKGLRCSCPCCIVTPSSRSPYDVYARPLPVLHTLPMPMSYRCTCWNEIKLPKCVPFPKGAPSPALTPRKCMLQAKNDAPFCHTLLIPRLPIPSHLKCPAWNKVHCSSSTSNSSAAMSALVA